MSFALRGAWKRISGVVSPLGSTAIDTRGSAGWTTRLALNGSNVEVQVTGAVGATISWKSTRLPQ